MKTFRALTFCGTVIAVLFATLAGGFAAQSPTLPSIEKYRRIVFLGDSITYSGQYIDYLDAYLTTRFPEQRWELLDLGLPSETVSGLSEPGHAGGKFPRPDLHERLDRVLAKTRPDLVVACYGMNCGIYHPFSEERFKKFQAGMQRLREKVLASGAKILHVTPPTFDPVPIKDKVLPAGRDVYEQPFEGYNQVLDRCSEWLLDQRQLGWDVVDLHSVMNRHLAERRKTEPGYILAKDGVHANATGHWLIAQEILRHWKAPAMVDAAAVEAISSKAEQGKVSDISTDGSEVRFTWQTSLPMPMDASWDKRTVDDEHIRHNFNQQTLALRHVSASRCQLLEGGKKVGELTSAELAAGFNLTELPALSTNLRAGEVLKLIRQRGRIFADAWLTECGHLRPGMKKGLPVVEADKAATELTGKIRELAAPVSVHLRLVPVKEN
ncbi:MAG: SGNH/GDSL hydrolase family protein [Verrucomicrobia bacterium]|nr:SGNH/GDSL hydrolase family protein [Verrucomicrobiota bacterium]